MSQSIENYSNRRKDMRITNDEFYKAIAFDKPIKVNDISENGIRFTLPSEENNPRCGDYFDVEISTPENKYRMEAKIMWQTYREEKIISAGALILRRRDHKKFIEAFSARQNKILPTEAKVENNTTNSDWKSKQTINQRLIKESKGIDDWISRNRYLRTLKTASDAIIQIGNEELINLGSNNYLGLTQHPKVKEAAIEAVSKYGAGAGSVRMLAGTMELHKELEEKLAQFKGAEAAVLLPSGYSANFSVLSTLLKKGDIVFNDELNHASIVDGCRASAAKLRFFRHANLDGLEKRLQQYPNEAPKLVITDGVFSMDGDIADLPGIINLAQKYNAMVMVDDAHATGVIGKTGHGSAEYCGVSGIPDITTCTLSKAIGVIGGAVCGSQTLIKTIIHRSRSFLFTSALPPAVTASALASLHVIETEPEWIEKLHTNRLYLYDRLKQLGFDVWETPTAIMPVIVGDENLTYEVCARLGELGVFVNAVSPPAVPKDLCRLRVSVMATHTQTHLDKAVDAFSKVGHELGLLDNSI